MTTYRCSLSGVHKFVMLLYNDLRGAQQNICYCHTSVSNPRLRSHSTFNF